MRSRFTCLIALALSLGMSVLSLPGETSAASLETAEAFHVSRVGMVTAAEKREVLVDLYKLIEADYNTEVEKQRAAQKKAYEGIHVRILKVLDESDSNGQLYLCAYDGGPKVFSIAGDEYQPGDLTPALKIEEKGTHEVEFTRTVVQRRRNPRDEPTLEKVDSSSGATFFGIPIPGPTRTITRSSPPKSSSSPASSKPVRKEVTEKKTVTKYDAQVSTDEMEEGPPLMSKDLFLAEVKNGNIFTVKRTEDRRCQRCRGFRRITDEVRPIGMRDPDGKISCPDCKEVGTLTWEVTYLVGW